MADELEKKIVPEPEVTPKEPVAVAAEEPKPVAAVDPALIELEVAAKFLEDQFISALRQADAEEAKASAEPDELKRREKTVELAEARLAIDQGRKSLDASIDMVKKAALATGQPVPILLDLARGSKSKAEFDAKVAQLGPKAKPVAVAVAEKKDEPLPPETKPIGQVDSGTTSGSAIKEPEWKGLSGIDKVMYAFSH